MEEVWRPRRRGRESHRAQHAKRDDKPREGGEPQGERRKRHRPRSDGYRAREAVAAPIDGTATPAEGAVAADAASTTEPGATPKREHQRGPRRNDRGRDRDKPKTDKPKTDDPNRGYRARDPKPEGRDNQSPGQGPGQGRGGRPNDQRGGGGRDRGDFGRGGDRKREERRVPMNVISSAPVKKAGAIDMDSPFAKLMALREAMAKGGNETSGKN